MWIVSLYQIGKYKHLYDRKFEDEDSAKNFMCRIDKKKFLADLNFISDLDGSQVADLDG
jgi:hypothetical protein